MHFLCIRAYHVTSQAVHVLQRKSCLASISRNVKVLSHLCVNKYGRISCVVPNILTVSRRAYRSITGEPKHTVKTLCKLWTNKFEEEGVLEPETSAELLIAHSLGKKMIHEVSPDLTVKQNVVTVIDKLCTERLKRIPVQYIIEEWDFHDLILKMRQPVFIPRPETEELASHVGDYIEDNNLSSGTFLEIGCGSGAISLYILNRFNEMTGVAVDKHTHACELTLENAQSLNLDNRINIYQLDIFNKDTLSTLKQYLPFSVIVSNPPYVPTSKMYNLDPEVIRYESRDALNGGEDGLDIVRQIIWLSPFLLSKGGQVWLEVDLGEPEMIKALVDGHKSLRYINTRKDFTKRDRFCVLQVY